MKTLTKINPIAGLIGVFMALIMFPVLTQAATFTAVANGSWSSSATWAGGVAPGSDISNDQVVIGSSYTVTASSDIMMDGVLSSLDVDGTLDAGANAVTVVEGTVSGTGEIITNEISLAAAAALTFAGQINTQTFINNGSAVALAAATTVENQVQLNGGSVVIGSGAFELDSGTEIVMNGGTISLNGGVFTATESYTVVYNGGSGSIGLEASGSGLSGIEVDLSSSNAQVSLGGDVMLNGDLDLTQGELVIGSNSLTVNGMINGSANGSIDASAGSELHVTTSGSGMVNVAFASSPELIGTFEFDGSSGATLQLEGDLEVSGDFDHSGGTIDLNGNTLTVSGDFNGSGEFEAGAGSAIEISGNGNIQGGLMLAAGGQMVDDITIDLTNGQTIMIGSDVWVQSDFDFQNGTIEIGSGNTLGLNGSASIGANAMFEGNADANLEIATSSSVVGDVSFSNGSATVGDLTVDIDGNGSVSLGSDLGVNGELDLQNGMLDVNGNTIMINGDIASGGSGSISVDGSSNVEVHADGNLTGTLNFSSGSSTAGDVTVDISGNGSVSLGSDLGINGELDLQNGMLDVNGNTIMINGDIASGGSGSISVDGSSNVEVHADGDLSGSLNFSSGSSTMGDLVIDIDNDGTVMLGSDAEVSGTLDLQNGFIAVGGSDLMVTGNVNGGSDGSYVVTWGEGSLMLDLAAATEAFFAVGTEASYAPATLLQASGAASGMFGVSVMNNVYSEGTAGTDMSTWGGMVDHTWNITSELSSNIDLTATLEWDAATEVNSFNNADCYISHYTNAAWDASATASATLNAEGRYEISRSGIGSLSPFAVFDSNTAVGIDEPEETLAVSFYPNPAQDVVTYELEGQHGSAEIQVFDVDGRVIMVKNEQNTRGVLDLGDHPAGIYTIRVTDDNNIQTARIVRQ